MKKFEIIKTTKFGRIGHLTSPHGKIHTPCFVFCATKGTIKGVLGHQMMNYGAQALLCNTYHLMPYTDDVYSMGGLHKMMQWEGPLWTDSGGFQIFSMGYGSVVDEIKGKRRYKTKNVKITEQGAEFIRHETGDKCLLTPEVSMQVQYKLGADFPFVFDECTPYHLTKVEVE